MRAPSVPNKMNEKQMRLSAVFTLFALLVMLSGFMTEWIFYGCALALFLIPYFRERRGAGARGTCVSDADADSGAHRPENAGAALRFCLPLIFPVTAVICALSMLCGWLFSLMGITTEAIGVMPWYRLILLYVLLPAVCEELIFRALPLLWLGDLPRLRAAVYCGGAFALLHGNFIQMPYAFFAGIIFYLADAHCSSLLPSVILHLMNNGLSVCLSLLPAKALPFAFAVFAFLTIVSFGFIYRGRAQYRAAFFCKKEKESKEQFSFCLYIPLIIGILTAILRLIL